MEPALPRAVSAARRGWSCWALDLYDQRPPQRRGRMSLDDHLTTMTTAASALDQTPVVIGYDLGSLLALLVAGRIQPRALVCISPLLPYNWQPSLRPPLPFTRLAALPALLWNRPHPPPSPRLTRDFLLHAVPTVHHDQIHAQLKPDSGLLVHTLTRGQTDLPATPLPCPLYIVYGDEDRLVPATAVHWLADSLQADALAYPDQGHWLFASPHAARLVADVHRWLIRTLGEDLLLPLEEEDE